MIQRLLVVSGRELFLRPLLVLADYVLCLTISFPAVCLQNRWVTQARASKNAPALAVLDIISCCRGGAAAEASARKTKPLDRCMAGCVSPLVRKGRFVLIALFSVAISLCAWQASDIPLPKSSDVQLLPDDHVLQQYTTWAKDLYGNRDPPAASKALDHAAAAAAQLAALPEPFRSFYARRAARELLEAAGCT